VRRPSERNYFVHAGSDHRPQSGEYEARMTRLDYVLAHILIAGVTVFLVWLTHAGLLP